MDRALSEFHLDQLTLKTLPAAFRLNLKLPSSFCKTPIDAARDPVDVLPYIPGGIFLFCFCFLVSCCLQLSNWKFLIPGDCWKQVLQGLGKLEDRKDAVCSMLACFMRHEIKLFHRGLYNQLPSKPEPTSYEHLHESSILKTMFSICHQSNKLEPTLVALALSILSKEFPRPLPPVSWNFMEASILADDESCSR